MRSRYLPGAVVLILGAAAALSTSGPPRLVADLGPPVEGSSAPDGFTALGPWLYFVADADDVGRELHRTLGTSASTSLVVDLSPGGSSDPTLLAAAGGRLFFFAVPDGTIGRELHVSNGTAVGTRRIDLVPGSGELSVVDAASVGGLYLFQRQNPAELWVSDGSVAGTFELGSLIGLLSDADILSGAEPLPGGGEGVYVYGRGTAGRGLYVTDGTVAGSRLIATSPSFSPLGRGVSLRPGVFVAPGGGLWVADVAAGTLSRLSTGPATLGDGVSFAGRAVFADLVSSTRIGVATDGVSVTPITRSAPASWGPHFLLGEVDGSLWFHTSGSLARLDPTSNVALVAAAAPGPSLQTPRGISAGGRLYYESSSGLVEVDPAAGSARLVFSGRAEDAALHLGEIHFSGYEPGAGDEPRVFAPSSGGTRLLANLAGSSGGSSGASGYTRFGRRVAFSAWGSGAFAAWASDGTPAGTHRLADIGGNPVHRQVGRELWIVSGVGSTQTVHASDGSAAGTRVIATVRNTSGPGPAIGSAVGFRGRLLFTGAVQATSGVFTLDRTGAVRQLVAANPGLLVENGDHVFVVAPGRNPGQDDVWLTDGTAAGSTLLGSVPARTSGTAVFDGRLWVSGSGGTFIADASGVRPVPSLPRDLAFAVAGGLLHGVRSASGEILAHDGTAVVRRTRLPLPPDASTLTAFGDRVLVAAADGAWVSDATNAGTTRLAAGTTGRWFAVASPDRAFFSVLDRGCPELFVTDGSVAGTGPLFGVEVAPQGRSMDVINGRLWITLDDPTYGAEPFVIDPGAVAERVGGACTAVAGRDVDLTVDRAPRVGRPVLLTGSTDGNADAGLLVLGAPSYLPLPLETGNCVLDVELGGALGVAVGAPSFAAPLPIPGVPTLVGVQIAAHVVFLSGAAPFRPDVSPGLLLRIGD